MLMRKLFAGFFLLIAAASLRPVSAFALDCDIDGAEGPGHISNGVWHYRTFDPSMGSDRPVIVRVTAAGSISRGIDTRRLGQPDRITVAGPMHSDLVNGASPAWTDNSLSGTHRAGNDDRHERSGLSATHPIPEPGNWAILMAGSLGVLTVARRRISSI